MVAVRETLFRGNLTMKHSIVADGPRRFAASEEYQARVRQLRQAVTAKYAVGFGRAGFFGRLFIRYLRHREFQQELRKITPSPQSCWFIASSRTESSPRGE